METEATGTPLLIYDGQCGFCRFWVDYWKHLTGDRVRYAPFQEVGGDFPQIPAENFTRSMWLLLPSGEAFGGAAAFFRLMTHVPGGHFWLRVYQKVPGFARITEAAYRFVAQHRGFLYKLTRFLWGKRLEPSSYSLTRWIFLRILGVVYLVAFASLGAQISGLIGERGILPVRLYLDAIEKSLGPERYWFFPTLAWLDSSDAFLKFLCFGGVALSLLLVVGVLPVSMLVFLWMFYLSLVTAGQDFLLFQWDGLLIETGFLAIFFAPAGFRPRSDRASRPSRAVLWLLRFLLFRLTFESGVVKLASGDPTWRDLSALSFHYQTQPLPTRLAWYAQQMPAWFQEFSTLAVFAMELLIPLLIFAPRRLRFFGAGVMMFFQVLITITGNYAFFNLLTIALCFLLFDDRFFRKWLPRKVAGISDRTAEGQLPVVFPGGRLGRLLPAVWRSLIVLLATLVIIVGGMQLLQAFGRGERPSQPVARILSVVTPLHIINSYGLFSVMTTLRPEIVIEGSNDGQTWQAYQFRFKPGDVSRAPRWVAPHQPRLDWQMWFAALGSYRDTPWFSSVLVRLLEGSPEVLALLEHNPFPGTPPRYVRALVYDYRFTDFATRRATGAWWQKEFKGSYFPVTSLRGG